MRKIFVSRLMNNWTPLIKTATASNSIHLERAKFPKTGFYSKRITYNSSLYFCVAIAIVCGDIDLQWQSPN